MLVGKKIRLICLVSLSFILLSFKNECFADTKSILYNKIISGIQHHTIGYVAYNPSKTAAIVELDMNLPVYINFKTKQTYVITDHWPGFISPEWKSDTVALVEGSCGTGCARTLIFIAPATVLSYPYFEYRIENLDKHKPPDYMKNAPLLIDPKKNIYVCYDNERNIQVLPLPTHATIRPPEGFFSEKAEMKGNKLIIFYENRFGKKKRIAYNL